MGYDYANEEEEKFDIYGFRKTTKNYRQERTVIFTNRSELLDFDDPKKRQTSKQDQSKIEAKEEVQTKERQDEKNSKREKPGIDIEKSHQLKKPKFETPIKAIGNRIKDLKILRKYIEANFSKEDNRRKILIDTFISRYENANQKTRVIEKGYLVIEEWIKLFSGSVYEDAGLVKKGKEYQEILAAYLEVIYSQNDKIDLNKIIQLIDKVKSGQDIYKAILDKSIQETRNAISTIDSLTNDDVVGIEIDGEKIHKVSVKAIKNITDDLVFVIKLKKFKNILEDIESVIEKIDIRKGLKRKLRKKAKKYFKKKVQKKIKKFKNKLKKKGKDKKKKKEKSVSRKSIALAAIRRLNSIKEKIKKGVKYTLRKVLNLLSKLIPRKKRKRRTRKDLIRSKIYVKNQRWRNRKRNWFFTSVKRDERKKTGRYKIYFIASATKIGNFNTPPVNMTHIINGGINKQGKVVGLHHKDGLKSGEREIIEITKTPNSFNVYEARVRIRDSSTGRWKVKQNPSTFFPDTWKHKDILNEITGAYNKAVFPSPTRPDLWQGKSSRGLIIQGSLLQRRGGEPIINTAYPLYQ